MSRGLLLAWTIVVICVTRGDFLSLTDCCCWCIGSFCSVCLSTCKYGLKFSCYMCHCPFAQKPSRLLLQYNTHSSYQCLIPRRITKTALHRSCCELSKLRRNAWRVTANCGGWVKAIHTIGFTNISPKPLLFLGTAWSHLNK